VKPGPQHQAILFASDFGPSSEWVGTCHAVIARIAPTTRIIDLTHALVPFDVTLAALVLHDVMPFASPSIAVLVVDPGVGSARRAIAVRCARGDVLVGPDNGLLTSVATALGGVVEAHELTDLQYQNSTHSSTFHARDIFCPVAAHLSLGLALKDVGPELDIDSLTAPFQPRVAITRDQVACEVTNVDRFGNARLSVTNDALHRAGIETQDAFKVSSGEKTEIARRVKTYHDLGKDEVGLIEDSFGWLCLVLNQAAAAQRLDLQPGSRIDLERVQCSFN
jgi:S-adenosyl-L-methionine hydrolase (adenosine-forming)